MVAKWLQKARAGKNSPEYKDEGIVRHRGKIAAAINNAVRVVELVASEGSLAAYFWRSGDAAAFSKDLKKRGWTP
jgi:DNA-3-methyladenine glycosylase I